MQMSVEVNIQEDYDEPSHSFNIFNTSVDSRYRLFIKYCVFLKGISHFLGTDVSKPRKGR